MLKMKAACERCSAPLGLTGEAFICSFECTYCPECTDALSCICPNCQGMLVLRPTRRSAPMEMPKSGFKAKLQKILP